LVDHYKREVNKLSRDFKRMRNINKSLVVRIEEQSAEIATL